jgi:hypothetical protein
MSVQKIITVNEGRIVILRSLFLHLEILLCSSPLTSFINCDNGYHYLHIALLPSTPEGSTLSPFNRRIFGVNLLIEPQALLRGN